MTIATKYSGATSGGCWPLSWLGRTSWFLGLLVFLYWFHDVSIPISGGFLVWTSEGFSWPRWPNVWRSCSWFKKKKLGWWWVALEGLFVIVLRLNMMSYSSTGILAPTFPCHDPFSCRLSSHWSMLWLLKTWTSAFQQTIWAFLRRHKKNAKPNENSSMVFWFFYEL